MFWKLFLILKYEGLSKNVLIGSHESHFDILKSTVCIAVEELNH